MEGRGNSTRRVRCLTLHSVNFFTPLSKGRGKKEGKREKGRREMGKERKSMGMGLLFSLKCYGVAGDFGYVFATGQSHGEVEFGEDVLEELVYAGVAF